MVIVKANAFGKHETSIELKKGDSLDLGDLVCCGLAEARIIDLVKMGLGFGVLDEMLEVALNSEFKVQALVELLKRALRGEQVMATGQTGGLEKPKTGSRSASPKAKKKDGSASPDGSLSPKTPRVTTQEEEHHTKINLRKGHEHDEHHAEYLRKQKQRQAQRSLSKKALKEQREKHPSPKRKTPKQKKEDKQWDPLSRDSSPMSDPESGCAYHPGPFRGPCRHPPQAKYLPKRSTSRGRSRGGKSTAKKPMAGSVRPAGYI